MGTHRAASRLLRFHFRGRLHPGRPAKPVAPGYSVVRKLEERRIVLPALLGEGQPAALPMGERPHRQDLEHPFHLWRRHPGCRRAGLRRLDAPHPPGGWQGTHDADDAGGERGRRPWRLPGPHCCGERSLRQAGAQRSDELPGAAQGHPGAGTARGLGRQWLQDLGHLGGSVWSGQAGFDPACARRGTRYRLAQVILAGGRNLHGLALLDVRQQSGRRRQGGIRYPDVC